MSFSLKKNNMLNKSFLAILSICFFAHSYDDCNIRFRIIRTFHKPIIFIFSDNVLKAWIYSGKGGYDWGNIEDSINVKLGSSDVKKICSLVFKIDTSKILPLKDIYDDGSLWQIANIHNADTLKTDISNPTIDTSKRNLTEVVKIAKLFSDILKLKELKANFY
jgi:hypothetical protein